MNILYITEDHSHNNYGITSALSQLVDELVRDDNIRVVIAVTGEPSDTQNKNVKIEFIHPVRWASKWRWSPGLLNRLDELVAQYEIDIIHIHGVWLAGTWAGLKIARKSGTPAILSVHGVLEQWFMKDDHLLRVYKKKIYLAIVLRPLISRDTIIHVITSKEEANIRHFFSHNKTILIPNAIQIKQIPSIGTPPDKMLLFLGRLHPIKGIELLLYACAKMNFEDGWHVVIAGPEEDISYSKMLKKEVVRLGLSQRVKFIGPVFGDAKWDLIGKAWVMIVPSFSEVIGMINLEAAVCKVPTITTFEPGLSDWEDGGGVLVHPSVDEVTSALKKTLSWTVEERLERGERSYQLVKEKYSGNMIIGRWRNLYKKLVGSFEINDE